MSPMRVACCAFTALLVVAGCGEDDVDVRQRPSGILGDSAVLQAMRSSDSGARIIYAPAPDLSLASAQQRRPDIFRAPTPAARPAAPKDTTSRARQP